MSAQSSPLEILRGHADTLEKSDVTDEVQAAYEALNSADIEDKEVKEFVLSTLEQNKEKIINAKLETKEALVKKLEVLSKVSVTAHISDALKSGGEAVKQAYKGVSDMAMREKAAISNEMKDPMGRKDLAIASLLGTLGFIAASKWLLKKKEENNGKPTTWGERAKKTIVGIAGFLGVFALSRYILKNYERGSTQLADMMEKYAEWLRSANTGSSDIKVKVEDAKNSSGSPDPVVTLVSNDNEIISSTNASEVPDEDAFKQWAAEKATEYQRSMQTA
jgi:hypothetical protein